MKKFALFSVLALSALFAFAQSDAPTVAETISTLQGDLTAIPVDAAVSNIEGWQSQLEGSDDPIVQGIATNLGELSTALQADSVDGAQVGGLLTSLGTDTVSAAEGAGSTELTDLGNLLLQAGTSLTGGMSGGAASGGMMSGGMMSGGSDSDDD